MQAFSNNSEVPGVAKRFAAVLSLLKPRSSMQTPKSSLMFIVALVTSSTTFVTAIGAVNKIPDLDVLKKCNSNSDNQKTLRIDEGWPFQVGCSELIEEELFERPPANTTEYQCVVTSEGEMLHSTNVSFSEDLFWMDLPHTSYEVSRAAANQSGTVFKTYLINEDRCTSMSHSLIVTNHSSNDVTCAEATPEMLVNTTVKKGDLIALSCFASRSTFFLDDETYQVTWYKGCNEIKSITITGSESEGDHVIVDQLQLHDASFTTTPGEYTCSVTYGGRRRFLTRTNLCVQYATPYSSPAFIQISEKHTKAGKGDDVTLTCGGTTGRDNLFSFAVIWFKNFSNGTTKQLCSSYFSHSSIEEDDAKYQCNDGLSNLKEASKCYYRYEDAMLDRIRGIITANSSLTIKNFQDSDAGKYVCSVVSTGKRVEVAFNVALEATTTLTIVAIVVGTLFFVVVATVLVIFIRRGYVQKHWKKNLEKSAAGNRNQRCLKGVDNPALSPSNPQCEEKDPSQNVV